MTELAFSLPCALGLRVAPAVNSDWDKPVVVSRVPWQSLAQWWPMTLFKPMRNAGGGGSFPNVLKLLFDLKTATFLASINLPMLIGTVPTTARTICGLWLFLKYWDSPTMPLRTWQHRHASLLRAVYNHWWWLLRSSPGPHSVSLRQNRVLKTDFDGEPVLPHPAFPVRWGRAGVKSKMTRREDTVEKL